MISYIALRAWIVVKLYYFILERRSVKQMKRDKHEVITLNKNLSDEIATRKKIEKEADTNKGKFDNFVGYN